MDFSLENMQERRQCNDIFKLMKVKQQTKPLQPSILYLLRISFKNKRHFNFMLTKVKKDLLSVSAL